MPSSTNWLAKTRPALPLRRRLKAGNIGGALAFDAVDFEGAKVSIHRNILLVNEEIIERSTPKSDASVRTISIPAALVELLRQQRKSVSEKVLAWGKDYQRKPLYVFPGPGGVAMNPKLVTRRMQRLAVKAGVDMTDISPCHSWRHTSGSLLWAASRDIKQVQERLGHSNPTITAALYIHNAPTADEAAAEVLGGLIKGWRLARHHQGVQARQDLAWPGGARQAWHGSAVLRGGAFFLCRFSDLCTLPVYSGRLPQMRRC
jgi:Phage integrase family